MTGSGCRGLLHVIQQNATPADAAKVARMELLDLHIIWLGRLSRNQGTHSEMDEVLTIEKIEARHAPEWVLIGEPRTDETLKLQAGKVLFHSPDQDAVCRKAMEYPPGRYALRFLGTVPEDLVLVL